MEIRHLRYFVTVAEEQNATRAAARLYVTQPCLSRQIRDLENEFQFALFERKAKAIRLTDAGRVFLVEARAVLKRAAEAVQAARAAADGPLNELHVGYADSLTTRLLPRALRFFEAECNETQVILRDLSTNEMLCRLRQNTLQVALLMRPSDKALKGLVFEEFCRQDVCVALNRTHRLARARAIDLRELGQERLIGYSREDTPNTANGSLPFSSRSNGGHALPRSITALRVLSRPWKPDAALRWCSEDLKVSPALA